MKKRKPILCLDFDGVIHSYTSGWKGADIIPDPPMEGAFEAITDYSYRFDVHIFSSRSHQEGGIEAMKKWFIHYGWPVGPSGDPLNLWFPTYKPPASVTLDDRALTFAGTFPNTENLTEFISAKKTGIFDKIKVAVLKSLF